MSKLDELKDELLEKERQYKEAKENVKSLKEEVQKLNKTVEQYSKETIKVTDHAVVRFLERSGLIEVKGHKKAIKDKIQDSVNAFGGGKYPLGNGLYAVVNENCTVVTVTEN